MENRKKDGVLKKWAGKEEHVPLVIACLFDLDGNGRSEFQMKNLQAIGIEPFFHTILIS
ncbi:hypothetical protein ACFYU8_06070 [Brevibacillus sp. NPDC003359]|uniref:hypothetical protein n=1 Tax=unclassified Brevibacillus TaxID=2684853 RepID=UPI0036B8412A